MTNGLTTILGGILAASAFIIAKKPNAKEWIDKITPYQGWIGVVLFIWGIFQILGLLGVMGWISTGLLLWWVIFLAVAVANLSVGFILGFGLISKYALSKNEEAMKKGQEIREKLLKIQVPLGFFAIIAGVLYIILVKY